MEARLWAELHGFNFFETSASTGAGITDMFQVGFCHRSDDSRFIISGIFLTNCTAGGLWSGD